MATSKKLIIFEGCDGAGKTTLAKAVAATLGAHYVHCGPFPGVNGGLARLYVEAISPAVLGLADVVLDRSWLSEAPYGATYRDGLDRLGPRLRVLERLAWRCETLVVYCQTDWERVLAGFRARRGEELLQHEHQLRIVWEYYNLDPRTSLPWTSINPFLEEDAAHAVLQMFESLASFPHSLAYASAGNRYAPILLVGEAFGNRNDGSPLYQWPFGGLTEDGSSLWLARLLDIAGIGEEKLRWVNADQLREEFNFSNHTVVSLGETAHRRLTQLEVDHHVISHPQTWKRFYYKNPYPLIPLLLELLNDA